MQSKKRIGLIGLGRLGLSFALLCDSCGYEVIGYDVNTERVLQIKDKTLKTSEPQIEELLQTSNLRLASSIKELVRATDLIFLLVATPSKESGEYDHSQIESVVDEIKKLWKTPIHKTLVVSATVMPGYCADLQERIKHLGINVVYSPSFIAQGSIVTNLQYADIVLLGGSDIQRELYHLYHDIMKVSPKFKVLSQTGAEITKIAINCYLTTKIAYANRIGEICINSGIESEVDTVLEAIGSDNRIGNKFLRYGYGFSGVCLPRDNRALGVYAKKVGGVATFQEMIDSTNDQHLFYLYNYFIKQNTDKSKPFIFYQLSYKKGVDILTDSQPLRLCKLFLMGGYSVNIVETDSVIEQVKPILNGWDKVSYGGSKVGIEIKLT